MTQEVHTEIGQTSRTKIFLKQSATEIRKIFCKKLRHSCLTAFWICFWTHPSKHLFVFKTSSRHVLKTSSILLQRNNFSSPKTSCKDALKTSWRHLPRCLEDVLEDEKLLCWRRLEEMSWRCLKDMSWRCLQNALEKNKMFSEVI